jgi:hypothetical protein
VVQPRFGGSLNFLGRFFFCLMLRPSFYHTVLQ